MDLGRIYHPTILGELILIYSVTACGQILYNNKCNMLPVLQAEEINIKLWMWPTGQPFLSMPVIADFEPILRWGLTPVKVFCV